MNPMETHLRQGRQTVKLGLLKVINDLFPGETLKISYSIPGGVFCHLAGSSLSIREVAQIREKLKEWAEADSTIEYLGQKDGYYQYKTGDMVVKTIYPAYTKASKAQVFDIIPFSYGFIIDFSSIIEGPDKPPLIAPCHLSSALEKTQRWMRNIEIQLVSDVNSYITSGKHLKIQCIAEALHEKEISDIADMILQHRRALRVVLIAGPSSSGKTTFAQRLSTQLRVNGLKPVALSLDNYFLNREETPRDEEGRYDFDSLEALDLPLLQEQLRQLVAGETVEVPIYDFVTGRRLKETITLTVDPTQILLIEGIHALNPILLTSINRNLVFKVYVSALGGLNIDYINRLSTSECRMIRRLVRDDRFRGIEPEATLRQWVSVRRGEYKNIFRFQEDADVMFNSSMLYELNALRPFAEASLRKIPDDSPYYPVKERLMNLLSFFEPMDVSKVPFNSILREFIGGSIYFNDR